MSALLPCRLRPSRRLSLGGVVGLVASLLLAGACTNAEREAGAMPAADSAASTGGSLVISAFADADILLPPLTMTAQGLQVVDAVFDRLALAQQGADGAVRYAPMLARQWRWTADSMAIDFTLARDARWHDGTPVTATDVAFSFRAYADPALGGPARASLRHIDSVQVRDAETVRIRFRRRTPEQFADAVDDVRILPAHLLDSIPRAAWRTAAFARQPVGSGRFRFVAWQAGTRLEVVADSGNYRGRPGLDRVVWTVSPDPNSAAQRLFTGDADFLEFVRPDAASAFATQPQVQLLKSPALLYGFLQFNLRAPANAGGAHPVFGDAATRRALSMAVDRRLLVQSVFDSLARVALGPVTRGQLGADTLLPAIPFDTAGAERLLDSIGWRRADPTATRQRNGRPLRFTTLVPSSSSQRVRLAVLMQEMFRRVGVDMQVERLEFNTLNERLATGRFDAALMALSADPKLGGIRGVWGRADGPSGSGVNFGRYASARFEAALDSADAQRNAAAARRAYRAAYEIILEEAPAIWLYEPWALSGISRAIRPVGIRPEGWWMQLGDWRRVEAP
jgi:peptide/nickel transport system substrate-binding protein